MFAAYLETIAVDQNQNCRTCNCFKKLGVMKCRLGKRRVIIGLMKYLSFSGV